MNYMIKKFAVLTLISSLVGCGALRQPVEPEVKVITQYAHVPETFRIVDLPPEVTREEYVTVGEALYMLSDLRTRHCILYSRYRELYRFASFGELIPQADETRCPRKIQ